MENQNEGCKWLIHSLIVNWLTLSIDYRSIIGPLLTSRTKTDSNQSTLSMNLIKWYEDTRWQVHSCMILLISVSDFRMEHLQFQLVAVPLVASCHLQFFTCIIASSGICSLRSQLPGLVKIFASDQSQYKPESYDCPALDWHCANLRPTYTSVCLRLPLFTNGDENTYRGLSTKDSHRVQSGQRPACPLRLADTGFLETVKECS